MSPKAPLIAHLIYRLDTGGLERVMMNCIHQLSQGQFRHVVISLTSATGFASQLPAGIQVFCLNKQPGLDLQIHGRLWKLLREVQPDVLHSYSLAALEYHPISWLAGVRGHIHAEHGRDISDPRGENKLHHRLRRLISPFLHSYVSVSADLQKWLGEVVGISAKKNRLIRNGVDIEKFKPQSEKLSPFTFIHVARLAAVKDQQTLLRATALLSAQTTLPFQVCIVGDGPERENLHGLARELELVAPHLRWLGEREDIAQLMAQSHVFVLSSIAEGIPMTVLEAMASGLAIISTRVGGLPEIIGEEEGLLVPAKDVESLASAMFAYLQSPSSARLAGSHCRERVCAKFSEQAMIAQYSALYLEVS